LNYLLTPHKGGISPFSKLAQNDFHRKTRKKTILMNRMGKI
jgi:hypothetical protein